MSVANERRLEKQLQPVPDADFDRINAVRRALATDPRPPGTVHIKGNVYRQRIGNWRLIYAVRDKERQVIIGAVLRRNDETYKNVDFLFS